MTPREWMGQWLAMLDRKDPAWRLRYDAEALEEAVGGLPGDSELDPRDLELLGELAMTFEEESVRLSREPRPSGPSLSEVARLFRRSPNGVEALRRSRQEAMEGLVEAVLDPLIRRMGQMERAAEMRERRRVRRFRRISDEGLLRAVGAGPETEVLGREAAERVTARIRVEFSAPAQAAVRRFFRNPEGLPACEIARRSGVSPATLTRALQRVRAVAAEELEDCRESILGPFTAALVEGLARA